MTVVALAEMTEKQWQAQVVDLARRLGFYIYHTHDSRRSASGWPDLALVRERLILLELKTETGKLSDAQRVWLDALDGAGVEVYVARPRHFDQLAQVLRGRHHNGDFLFVDQSGEIPRRARTELRAEIRKELGR